MGCHQNPARLESLVKRYIDKVAAFKGDDHAGLEISQDAVQLRVPEIGVPRSATPGQMQAFDNMAAYAQDKGVTLKVEVVR